MTYKGSKMKPKFDVVPNKRNAFTVIDKSNKCRPKIKTTEATKSEADDWVKEHSD